ncbi:MAG TPA: choice-of-anchor X domain-containing protein, partial [Planctomycetota bacterium]|nr:choice-of-anchor X domain-containing protein [Planctomycetota bacterium]
GFRGGAGAAAVEAPGGEALKGAGGGVSASFPSGDVYSGVIEPGGAGVLPLISDTSESIIIILNSDLPGGIRFQVLTPGLDVIDPPRAGALDGVEYHTYGDGEGHEIQVYTFEPGEVGEYGAILENPAENVPVRYTLEAYVESDLRLEATVVPEDIEAGGEATIVASLARKGAPETGSFVQARVLRPDGSLEVFGLLDDGQAPDVAALDGLYTAMVTAGVQAGIHGVEVSATGNIAVATPFEREATTRFHVLSDAARFVGGFSSGTEDANEDQTLDYLWVDGMVEADLPGIFLVTGRLTDLDGNPVAAAGILFSIRAPGMAAFRLYFDGSEIYTSHRNGPFSMAEVVLLDGSAGFVEADRLEDAHTTPVLMWSEFGIVLAKEFIRGDSNADSRADISDCITILEHLFTGGQTLGCLDAADVNNDANLDVSDAVYLLSFLFGSGAAPPAPYPLCGVADGIGCGAHSPCD